jgi:predicted MFS family arabinose efflux permease
MLLSVLLGLVGAGTNIWVVRGLLFLIGCSAPNMMLPLQTAAFANVSQAATGAASSVYSAARQVAGAAGVAVLSTVLATIGTTRESAAAELIPHLAAYHVAMWSAALLAGCAALAASTLRDSDAASTMRATPRTQDEPA